MSKQYRGKMCIGLKKIRREITKFQMSQNPGKDQVNSGSTQTKMTTKILMYLAISDIIQVPCLAALVLQNL